MNALDLTLDQCPFGPSALGALVVAVVAKGLNGIPEARLQLSSDPSTRRVP